MSAEGVVAREIRRRLEEAFAPQTLEITDESERHRGHAGWREGGETHFRVLLVSAVFEGVPRLERQRRIHALLADLLRERIHALSVRALTPEEAARADPGG